VRSLVQVQNGPPDQKVKKSEKKEIKIQHPYLEKEGMLDKNPVRTLKTA
jgi:hypothetical protein